MHNAEHILIAVDDAKAGKTHAVAQELLKLRAMIVQEGGIVCVW
jgi:hypothetical protein